MKSPVERYGFSAVTVNDIRPIIEAFEQNKVFDAERKICELAVQVCGRIESSSLTPMDANNYFLLLDLYRTDHYPNLKLSNEVEEILFEGMTLHDYGTEYGPNLDRIRKLANDVLIRKSF